MSSLELMEVSWSSLEFLGVSWSSLELLGVPWSSLELLVVRCSYLLFLGDSWSLSFLVLLRVPFPRVLSIFSEEFLALLGFDCLESCFYEFHLIRKC